MANNIFNHAASLLFWDWRATTFVVLLSPFMITYLVTFLRSTLALRQQTDGRSPPISPYFVPIFGNLVEFLYDPCQTASNIR